MSRRSSLPGAAELFRSTGVPEPESAPASGTAPLTIAPVPERAEPDAYAFDSGDAGDSGSAGAAARPVRRRPRSTGERRPSGRERHDEKITVYVSAEELMDLEHARLGLRGDHGLAVDRGRIVREALAFVIADLEAKGETSILVRRLRGL